MEVEMLDLVHRGGYGDRRKTDPRHGGARLKNSEQKKVELWETKATNLLLGFDRNKNQNCSPKWCDSNGAGGSCRGGRYCRQSSSENGTVAKASAVVRTPCRARFR
jgi:hypothetical protein